MKLQNQVSKLNDHIECKDSDEIKLLNKIKLNLTNFNNHNNFVIMIN